MLQRALRKSSPVFANRFPAPNFAGGMNTAFFNWPNPGDGWSHYLAITGGAAAMPNGQMAGSIIETTETPVPPANWHDWGGASNIWSTSTWFSGIIKRAGPLGRNLAFNFAQDWDWHAHAGAGFDLGSGSVAWTGDWDDGTRGGCVVNDASIGSLGSGWYRIRVRVTFDQGPQAGTDGLAFNFNTDNANWTSDSAPYAGDGLSGLYLGACRFASADEGAPW